MWNSTGVEKSEYIGNLKILKYRILLFITTYYCPFFIPQGAIAFIITIFKRQVVIQIFTSVGTLALSHVITIYLIRIGDFTENSLWKLMPFV